MTRSGRVLEVHPPPSEAVDRQRPPRPPDRKAIGFLVTVAFPLVASLFGGWIALGMERSVHRADLQERARARALGMPLEFADIGIPRVSDAENAAPIYERIGALLDGPLKKAQSDISTAQNSTATAEDRAAGVRGLSAMAPMFRLLDGLSTRPKCQFRRDWNRGTDLMLPEYGQMKACVRDLCSLADLEDTRGEWKSALSELRIAHRVATDVGTDPLAFAVQVQSNCRLILDHEYETLIARHTADTAFLAMVDPQLRAATGLPNLRRAMSGEIAMGVIDSHRPQIISNPDPRLTAGDEDGDGPDSGDFRNPWTAAPVIEDSLERAFLLHWERAWEALPADETDWQGYRLALRMRDREIEDDQSLLVRITEDNFAEYGNRFIDAIGTVQARDRLLIASVRLLRARFETGRLPLFLPSGLGEFRIDPFDGNLLRYRRLTHGFKLYSIGEDRVDDLGRKRSNDDPGSENHNDEVVEFH